MLVSPGPQIPNVDRGFSKTHLTPELMLSTLMKQNSQMLSCYKVLSLLLLRERGR